MNYRKYYAEFYGIKFGPEYHIHHINFNREDNSIGNLILLPAELHNRLHKCRQQNVLLDGVDNFKYIKGNLICGMCADTLRELADIYDALFEWVAKREAEYMAVMAGEPGKTCGCPNYNSFRKSCEK